MTVGIIVLIVFFIAAILMFFRKLPAILALPLMALAIAGIEVAYGRLTIANISSAVIADGALRLSEAMVISMFGGMLSVLMQKVGVAESFVRKGAELSGDNPFVVALVMLGIIALLFTTIGGLGAVIMVGTIVLPILSSIGVREYISAGVVLFGISLGGIVNPNNWAIYKSVLGLETSFISSFALTLFIVVGMLATVFLVVELWLSRSLKIKSRMFIRFAFCVIVVGVILYILKFLINIVGSDYIWSAAQWIIGIFGIGILLLALKNGLNARRSVQPIAVRWYAYLIPLVPLVLIIFFKVPFVPAFLCGLVYGIIVTLRKGSLNMATRSMIEGSQSVIPAIVLMIGIGMLLSAILGPTKTGPAADWYNQKSENTSLASQDTYTSSPREWPVLTDMKPLLKTVVPESFISYVLIFTLLGPLALYRGPLNVWGLGYGIGGVLLATGVPAGAIMGVLMSLGIIQGVSDPTNTQNVWIANEVRLDVNTILWKTLPYSWIVAFIGLVIAGIRFYL